MGGGSYSFSARADRSATLGWSTMSAGETFKSKAVNNAMDPHGISVRQSLDSVEHPNTVPIILALDVTGSMGSVPHYLVKEGLPTLMEGILKAGIADPQVLFLAIGDHQCDSAPLQVGQFESSDELLDHWLTKVYLEGGGGGNDGESYLLAWYFAASHTEIDSFSKRNTKGWLFTVGDEPTLAEIPARKLRDLMGDGEYQTWSASELLDQARERYNVFHLHVKQTKSGSRQDVMDGWKQLMGEDLVIVERREDIPRLIAEIVTKGNKIVGNTNNPTSVPTKVLENLL